MMIHHRPESLQVSGSVDCDFRNQKGPIQSKRGRRLKDLDWIVLWRDPLKMVCWDVQDACVFWWESFFNFSFFFSSSKMCGNVSQASRPNGEPFCWNFAENSLFVFPPQHFPLLVFGIIVLLLFLFCGVAKEETDLPVESCHPQPVLYYIISLFESQKSCFHFPSVESQFKVVSPPR